MSHRKLQQEIERVFKKIAEGLEIFDTYYERHENCTNNPSQKDKLESDLKREVKKLQRLREQIKSWQSSPDIKDKDALLDHRRRVEIAMEKYKAVEKASKEKAYSNISLKKVDTLDPQERARKEVSDYLSDRNDDLERQYDYVQVEIDRLILLNKKKKTFTQANEDRKEQLKVLQSRYRWHQQQIELALRLLANEELDPENVRAIQDDLNYYVESNQEPDFVEDETIYDGLNLQSNEAIAHEVAQYFASQHSDDMAAEEDGDSKDSTKLSRKEQRRLEREAKKAAKAASKIAPASERTSPLSTNLNGHDDFSISYSNANDTTNITSASELPTTSSPVSQDDGLDHVPLSRSSIKESGTSSSISTPLANRVPTAKIIKSPDRTESSSATSHNHTHIQTQNGMTSATTLKPATVPMRPVGDLKWSVAASQGLERATPSSSITTPAQLNGSTISRSNVDTPLYSHAPSIQSNINNVMEMSQPESVQQINPSSASAVNAAAILASGAAAVTQNNQSYMRNSASTSVAFNNITSKSTSDIANSNASEIKANEFGQQSVVSHGAIDSKALNQNFSAENGADKEESDNDETKEEIPEVPELLDDYEVTSSEEYDDNNIFESSPPSSDELEMRAEKKLTLVENLSKDFETLLLPSGIQEFIVGMEIQNNGFDYRGPGSFRGHHDLCYIPRLDEVPLGVNPPSPLDAFRSTEQWDKLRLSLRSIIISDEDENKKFEEILERFRALEMFTLFYNYYFSITPLEKRLASIVLNEREWRVSKNDAMWFLRQGEAKLLNPTAEVGNYKIFKLDDWTVIDKINFRLDYSMLKNHPNRVNLSNPEDQDSRSDSASWGRQLLKQLKSAKNNA